LAKSQSTILTAFYIKGGGIELIPIYPLYAVMFMEHGVSTFEFSVLYVLIVATCLLSMSASLDEFIGPLLREKEFSLRWIGYLSAAIFLAQALGNFLAEHFRALRPTSAVRLMGGGGLLLFGAAYFSGYLVFCFLALFFFFFGLGDTLFAAYLQREIETEARATVLSVVSFVKEIGNISVSLLFGWIALDHGMDSGTGAVAAATVVFAVGLVVLGSRWGDSPP